MKIERLFSWVKEFLYKYVFFVFIFLGIILIISSKLKYDDYIQDILKTVGTTLLGGGVMSAILKSFQFSNIFKEELESIIYSSEFLAKRKDLNAIWKRVSKSLYMNHFPEIADDVEDHIREYYLPASVKYYLRNFYVSFNFSIVEDRYLKVEENFEYEILSSVGKKKFDYKFDSMINLPSENPEKSKIEFQKFEINKKEIRKGDNVRYADRKGKRIVTVSTPLSGKTVYKVKRSTVKIFNLEANRGRLFQISKKVICKGLTVEIFYPEGLKIQLFRHGTVKQFKTREYPERVGMKRATYDGILFPKQGFRLFISNQKTH